MWALQELKGNLFSCPDGASLAHCVSEDMKMSKGIAVLFKDKFGGVEELLQQNKKTGDVAVLKRGNRYVYYLVTKYKFYNKSTYSNLRRSLAAMKTHCLSNQVQHLAMPRIGCGLDGLDWGRVSGIIKEIFQDSQMIVTVYSI